MRHLAATAILLLATPLQCLAQEEATAPEQAAPCDTLLLDPAQPQLEAFDQPMETTVFVPKGQWVAGVSISYTQSNQNNYQFLVLENINGDSYTFKVSPMVCYLVKDDMGLGGKFAYSRALTKLKEADIVLDSETSYGVDKLYLLSHNYSAMAIMRNYFPFGTSKRFGFFTEVQLQLGGGQSKITQGAGMDIIGSYSTNFNFNVGLAPGLIVFLNNYSALEVNVGVLGFNYTHSHVISNQIRESNLKTMSTNFKINLFSITFGMAFYI